MARPPPKMIRRSRSLPGRNAVRARANLSHAAREDRSSIRTPSTTAGSASGLRGMSISAACAATSAGEILYASRVVRGTFAFVDDRFFEAAPFC